MTRTRWRRSWSYWKRPKGKNKSGAEEKQEYLRSGGNAAMNISESALRWRYYGGGSSLVGIAVGLFLGTIFLLVGYFVWRTEEDYAKNGVAANATVTRKDQQIEPHHAGQKGGPRTVYTLHYRYQD